MDFDRYVDIIKKSAAESGYDDFLPSLCVVGDDIEMSVLELDLDPGGDEAAAKDWASEFAADSLIVYLAYRSGDRAVAVLEITGFDVTQKMELNMAPYGE